MKENLRILITGARGFLGSHVYELFLKKHYLRENLLCPTREDYNLTVEEQVDKMFQELKPEIVIHIAGDVGGIGYSRNNPATQLYNNLMMNTLLLDRAFRNNCIKFVGIGSVCSYPKNLKVPFKEENIWEGYPEETNAAYGLSKKIMMEQTKAYKMQYNFNSVHLLMINLFGPRDNFDINSSHVIPAMIKKIDYAKQNNDEHITIWGDGTPTREFLFVDDAAEAIVLATENYNDSYPINIGSGSEISIFDLVSLISNKMDYKGKFVFDKSKPNGQPRRLLDVSKAKSLFGFNAKTSLDEGIDKTIRWYNINKKILNTA